MGQVSSRPGDEASPLYLRDQARFSIASLTITNSRKRLLLSISPNAYPATRYTTKRDINDDLPVEYIQDPESGTASIPPSYLLRLSNDDDLVFNFTFVQRQIVSAPTETPAAADTTVNGLTFLTAASGKELDNLVTKELQADPNFHKTNPNVQFIGDYNTNGSASVQYQWTWKWKPPRINEDRGGGWRNCCSFVEYDQRNHRLRPLASFTFWVQNSQRVIGSPKTPSPRLEIANMHKLRVPSAQSIESRVSDSDTGGENKDAPRESPTIEPIPEDGLGLIPTATISTVTTKVDCGRPGEDVTQVEDGPLFRATMKSMEQRTGSMRARWKKVLRRAEAAVDAQAAVNDSMSGLMEALRDASSSNSNAVQPAIEHYFDKIAKEILVYEKQNAVNLQKMIIEPISKLYNVDIKQAENKKRDFEEESKEYYQYVSRYLGQRQDSLKEKKRAATDEKYQKKKRDFELKRFDYSSFMQDLHGGRKDQEVLSNLTKFADAQAKGYLFTASKIEALLPQLEALNTEVKEADKEFRLHRTEREEKRRALEKGGGFPEPDRGSVSQMALSTPSSYTRSGGTELTRAGSAVLKNTNSAGVTGAAQGSTSPIVPSTSVPPTAVSAPQPSMLSSSPSQSNKFKGFRDLEEKDYSAQVTTDVNGVQKGKEGLVWALSRPGSHADPKGLNKQAWHKFWIVLDQGKLSEYTGWKEKLDLHMEPIDLRIASVREARNAERRFCFEVVTPQFTRVYQSQSEEDMRNWINSINNALQSAVEGRGLGESQPRASSGSINRDIASVLTGKSASTSGYRSGHGNSKAVGRHATVNDRPAYKIEVSEGSQKLLQQIRDCDAGNKYCADCNSDNKVDWVSINLGIVICIECSGIHRSLGTHISKVRSLTLDPNAFTMDVIEILLTVGNRVSNMIWEARLPDTALKPSPQGTREQRLRFITAKYVERAYVQPISATLSHYPTPDETLLASIKKNDIQNVIYALALKANPNVHDRSRNTHAVFLALAAADPASPSMRSSPAASPNPSRNSASASIRKPFHVAEILILNGADPPVVETSPIPLSHAARLYLEVKDEQKSGRKTQDVNLEDNGVGHGGDTLTALPSIQPSSSSAGGGLHRDSDRERLRKRVSASGRLVKPSGGPAGMF
ncbi:ArfGap domain-containing protein [Venturia nashicola]|nr:ArfGap domain-containing protein [Venturia nashicola]